MYSTISKHKEKLNRTFTLVVTLASLLLIYLPTGFKNSRSNTEWVKAEAVHVDNSEVALRGLTHTGIQKITAVINRGEYRGDTLDAPNVLLGDISRDRLYKVGDPLLLTIKERNGVITSARTTAYERSGFMVILLILFALFLIAFAGWTGLKALISFLFTALAIWKILIPCFLKGYSPLPISFLVIALSTGVIILLITGFTRKGLVALSGSLLGVGVTAVLALLFGSLFSVPGTVQQFSEALLYSGLTNLRFTDILLSGIFLSAAGAVMDVAMDIAASQEEIALTTPNICRRELTQAGFRIGKSVIGTMTTTLLFAYSGTFTCTLMLFMARGNPFITMVNTDYVAAEILHTLVGSFGLVLVAPLTAVIGGYVFTKKRYFPDHHTNSPLQSNKTQDQRSPLFCQYVIFFT